MDKNKLCDAFIAIRDTMDKNKDFLTDLDARYGDGDLGVSMCSGFQATCESIEASGQTDLGQLLRGCSNAFNAAAPSTLGTLFSFLLMGMAKRLKGLEDAELQTVTEALSDGVALMMQRGGSAPGEKTIIDSILPAVNTLRANANELPKDAFYAAYLSAVEGLEATKGMIGKHGRVAYYGEKTLGSTDAGATAGMLIFHALKECFA